MAWIRRKGSATQPPDGSPAEATAGTPVEDTTQTAAKETAAPSPQGKETAPEAAEPAASAPQEPAPNPLFYSKPVVLSSTHHEQWRLLPGDLSFARNASSIPLVGSDFPSASRSYPILFAMGEAAPVALVGFERVNLFVEDGRWAEGTYIPAYVRRHPFIMVESVDRSTAALAVDAGSDLINQGPGTEGALLFEGGRPSAVTLRALEFCRIFSQDHARSRAFSQALMEEGLLIERRANVSLANGRQLGIGGFQVVDPQKFADLPEEKVVTWHRNGWLGLVHFHLASLERFSELLRRHNQRDAVATH